MTNQTKIPITIGIIGHTDAIITDEHREKIRAIFEGLLERYPNSPLVLFSQLAPGADTEVAEIFLEVKEESGKDLRLVVPIPYQLENYKQRQFKGDEKKEQRFEGLLKKAERYFVLSEDDSSDGAIRHRLYREGGQFVADGAMVVIALRSEVDNIKKGGTSDTVYYIERGCYRDEITKDIFKPKRRYISIDCNRRQEVEENEKNGKKQRVIKLKDNYLEELLSDNSGTETPLETALNKVEELNAIELKEKDITDEYLENVREVAARASYIQDKYRLAMKALFVLGLGILISFEFYKSSDFAWKYLGVFALFLLLSGSVLKWARYKRYHMSYVENRALAEALRVQKFWNRRGLPDNAAKHIISIYKKEYQWLPLVVSAIWGYDYKRNKNIASVDELMKDWVTEQKNYFKDKILLYKKAGKKVRWQFRFLVGVGIVLLAMIQFLPPEWKETLLILDTVIFGSAFLLREHWQWSGNQELIRQYQTILHIFEIAKEELSKIPAEMQKEIDKRKKESGNEWTVEEENKIKSKYKTKSDNILLLLGEEALLENGRWYMLYKDRELEIKGLN